MITMKTGRTILKRIWISLLVLCLITVAMPIHVRAASQTTQEVGNLVVFVKFNDDNRDIYNAVYDSGSMVRRNWDLIKKMYDANPTYDYSDGNTYDNSFKNYISEISDGKVNVTNYFPQELLDNSGVNTYILSKSASEYNSGSAIAAEVMTALQNGSLSVDGVTASDLCHLQNGFVDCLTIIVQGTSSGRDDIVHPHQAQYGGTETVLGLKVCNYIIMPSGSLVTDNAEIGMIGQQEQGVIAHEFLHVLGFPDLYRYGDDGVPVGAWDVMASNSMFLQYPLSYLRAEQGWIDMQWISMAGTYTLTAVSEEGGNQVYAIKTPLSDSEYIVLEYRKQSESLYDFEHRIPTGGLLMYRVDDKVEYHTNAAGENYIYVYRPDVTDPEAGKDYISGTATSTVYNAAIDVENGETEYGSTDLSKSYTENTLYYSDGQNSGIRISNVQLSQDQSQLTFTIEFADYEVADIWNGMGESLGSNLYGRPALYTDSADGTVYMAYTEQQATTYSVVVKKWNGSTWEQVGTTISNAWEPQIIVNAGTLYLSYQKKSDFNPVYCKLSGNAWSTIKEMSASYATNMQFVEDASNLYVAYVEDSGSSKRLVIWDLKKNKLVNNTLSVQEFGNPSVCKVGSFFYVAYSDFFAGEGSNYGRVDAFDIDSGTWENVHQYNAGATNCHVIKSVNGKIYAFAGGTSANPVVSVYDGAEWIDTTVTQMTEYLDVSMDIIGDEVYLSYIDTVKSKVSVLRKEGNVFVEYYDNLGTGTFAFSTASYDNIMYAAVKAQNTTTVSVKSRTVELPKYTLTITPPSTYTDANIYVDGIAYAAAEANGSYSVNLSHTSGRTAVMYYYDSSGIPKGMYVWTLKFVNGGYTATAQAGLQDLLSYHGFSIRVQDPAGIRFKSGIDETVRTQLLGNGVDGFTLEEYGTLMMTNANRSSFPFVKLGRKTASGRSYWIENGTINDKIFETVSGRVRFASVLTGLPESQYNTDFAFRGYIILEKDGEKYIIYGPAVHRSVYTVAKQIQARGEFEEGSSGYEYIEAIISSVEGN